MKRILLGLLAVFLLGGCKSEESQLRNALAFRNAVLNASGCSFSAKVTTDYGDSIYVFTLDCTLESNGEMRITVTEPESIAGITCTVAGKTGKLLFDETALLFETLTDGQITPIISPWLFMKAVRSGYISQCGSQNGGMLLRIDDTFSDTSFCTEIRLNENRTPIFAEILWQGRRIVSMQITNFTIL